jgi:hypothetical protein
MPPGPLERALVQALRQPEDARELRAEWARARRKLMAAGLVARRPQSRTDRFRAPCRQTGEAPS